MSECVPSRCGDVHCGNLSQYPILQDWLPTGYDYHVVEFEERPTETTLDHSSFCATMRLSLKTQEEVTKWALETKDTPSHVTWRPNGTGNVTGKKNLYRKDYRCQHNVRGRSSTSGTKNTNCPAKLAVIIKADPALRGVRFQGKRDFHLPQYPTVVILQNLHNHAVHSAAALKHRDVGGKATDALISLFDRGCSPAAGLAKLRRNLQAELGDDYEHAASDRALNPDVGYCKRLHRTILRSTLVESMRSALASVENLVNHLANDPKTSNHEISAMTKKLQDIAENPPEKKSSTAKRKKGQKSNDGPTSSKKKTRRNNDCSVDSNTIN